MRKKRQSSQQCHLAFLGPRSVKAACKTLVKSTPGHLLVNNQKVGQKVQVNVLFGQKVCQILTYPIVQTKS